MNNITLFGLVLIIVGAVASVFTVTTEVLFGLFTKTTTPYSTYMLPLIIGGIVLIVIGGSLDSKKREKITQIKK